MSKIRIKNFGPIKEGLIDSKDGFVEINKVTLFIGPQGSGKSAIAKLISTFTWLEKKLDAKDIPTKITSEDFINNFLSYHLIDSYVTEGTDIDYVGDVYEIGFERSCLCITKSL